MINQDFFLALEELEKEKGISQEEFVSALSTALIIAYKKHNIHIFVFARQNCTGSDLRLQHSKFFIKLHIQHFKIFFIW